MDVCVVNWEIVSTVVCTLVTVGVAYLISKQWSEQKKSEVLAEEAKKLISELFELNKLISKAKNYEFEDKDLKKLVEDFGFYRDVTSLNIKFFKNDIDLNSFELLEELSTQLNNYYLKIERFKTSPPSNPAASFVLMHEIASQNGKDYLDVLILSIDKALDTLRNVALYKNLK